VLHKAAIDVLADILAVNNAGVVDAGILLLAGISAIALSFEPGDSAFLVGAKLITVRLASHGHGICVAVVSRWARSAVTRLPRSKIRLATVQVAAQNLTIKILWFAHRDTIAIN